MKNDSKIVLITGCSSGFGLLTAVRLSRKFNVYATMRDLNKKEALVAALRKSGGKATILELDVTENKSIIKVKEQIEAENGKLDILINNAGYAQGGFFEDLSEQEIREQMETNFFGVQKVTRALLPLLRKSGQAKIINLSSIAGRLSLPGLGAYNTSKWAIEGFSEGLRLELMPFGIKVVLIEPGVFGTNVLTSNAKLAKNYQNETSPYHKYSANLLKELGKTTKKMANPDIVAKKIEKIVDTKNPRLRYLIGTDAIARNFLKMILPFKFVEKIIYWVIFK